ncbi:LOW QUALITY PROTEIN: ATP-dependent RNA helicase DRS1-like [Daphnia magna]|uniref:LOW QUALITY PROTEIN: ATP-dependent RNA helicase DRS1-like n=1 Tax=Daphnia magna TaxID=35525 RepID=UPI001E1BD85F|nr:LOW QUALITY PROTEIN: ATP-dependent RNA helicase DRS1-like [Daphnia magna]
MYSYDMENPVASSLIDSPLDPFKERDNDQDGDMKNLEHGNENNSSESDDEENKEQDIHELETEEKMPMVEANVPLVSDRNVTDAQLVGVHPEAEPEKEKEQMLPQENDEAPLRRSRITCKKVKALAYQHPTTRP